MASPKEASADNQEFNSAAKIVKNFENPQRLLSELIEEDGRKTDGEG